MGEGHSSVSLPLPIILYTDNGIVSFLSSEFNHDDHGIERVEKNGQYFIKNHEHIYYAADEADAHGSYVSKDAKGNVTNKAPIDFSITKNVFSMFVGGVIVVDFYRCCFFLQEARC
jgi:F-type H+-transporting ATPase subunit a